MSVSRDVSSRTLVTLLCLSRCITLTGVTKFMSIKQDDLHGYLGIEFVYLQFNRD